MQRPSTGRMRGEWRRALFAAWIGASALIALYVGIAAPFASGVGEGRSFVAMASPALMVFPLATGLGWLAFLAASRPAIGRRVRRAAGDPICPRASRRRRHRWPAPE